MPASAAWARPEDLVKSLSSLDNTARLKARRDVRNQIIGNKTKKLSYIKLGAVPRVVEILASDTEIPLLVQSAAALGSFACGIDAGVRAVLDSGVLPHLLKMLPNGDQVKTQTLPHFHKRLVGTISMTETVSYLGNDNGPYNACTEPEVPCLKRTGLQAKMATPSLRLTKEKSPLTRLLACMCLVNIGQACPAGYAQEAEVRANMLRILMKLLEVPGKVGEYAPGVLADLVANNEELQKTAADQNAVEKLADFLL